MFKATSSEELLGMLKRAMAHRAVTQQLLATRLGHSSHTNVNMILNGRAPISVAMLIRMAWALDLELEISLIPYEDIPGRRPKYPPGEVLRTRGPWAI